ncbi:hypothetical protein COT69_01795 [candidate division WWE3 bacterium CG09_land_8_20_14_0_10_39_24]|uniref:Uncharacterized protein n=1 Tax=candidate division WWE3 bacterium CG09_land_8_20_14_0_10_39_24 TaxID=1975088 RepID=A0A2H0WLT9_UNCKA|nr:MAG: hypothetical protein COT69_01795 [candidate division WWE3 bacterium CG09_land_8_20_14_0_10_39_24]
MWKAEWKGPRLSWLLRRRRWRLPAIRGVPQVEAVREGIREIATLALLMGTKTDRKQIGFTGAFLGDIYILVAP